MENIRIIHESSDSTLINVNNEDVLHKCLSPIAIVKYFYLINNSSLSTSNNSSDLTTNTINLQSTTESLTFQSVHDLQNLNLVNSLRITPESFLNLCPMLLAQVESGECSHKHHASHKTKTVENGICVS